MAKSKESREPAPTGPTRGDVEELFRELLPDARWEREQMYENDPDYILATNAVSDREAELGEDSKLSRLKDKVKRVKQEALARTSARRERAERVRREYRAKGLTEEVAAKIAKLVDEVNKG